MHRLGRTGARSLIGRAFSTLLISSLVATHASGVFAQSEEVRAGARAAATEGAQAFRDQKWPEAVDLFSRAESLVHAPPHLLYLARAEVKLGQLVKAQENYNKIIRENIAADAPKAFREAQSDASKEIKDLEPRIPYLNVTVKGEAKGLKVTMDGAPVPAALIGVPHPVDPGEHRLQAAGEGMTSDVVTATLKEGARQTIEIPLKLNPSAASTAAGAVPPSSEAPISPLPPRALERAAASTSVSTSSSGGGSSGLRVAGFIGLGVGVVGFGLAGAFALKASGKHKDADDLYSQYCAAGCATGDQRAQIQALDDDANSAKKTANLGVALGLVGIAGGATLLILGLSGGKENRATTGASVTPWMGPGSAGLAGTF